jgi:CHASE1-domain containing sensor protein
MNMSGTKTNHWVPLLVLGASLMVGLYMSEYATKKIIK